MSEVCCLAGRSVQSRARKQAGGLAITHAVGLAPQNPLPDGRGSERSACFATELHE